MVTSTIRQVQVSAIGGPDVLTVTEVACPEPAAGQLLVEVTASGVNFVEVYRREGIYPATPPFALGTECAGRVIALGAGVTDFAIGDVVATESGVATHADAALIDAERAVAVPAGLSGELAAAVMLQGITAQYLVSATYPVQAGQDVLVHAAAGGVGQLLVQLVKARGARVIATVGSAAKARIATERGADVVLRYDELDSTDELSAAIRDAAVTGRVHVAYDGVGRATFEASLAALHVRGMLVLYGASSGQVPPFDLQRLNTGGSLYVTRPTLGHYVATSEALRERAAVVLTAVADGSLQVEIGGRYGLDDAADAYRDLESRRSTGKLLLVP
jgi:NADPH2:quinone reductase